MLVSGIRSIRCKPGFVTMYNHFGIFCIYDIQIVVCAHQILAIGVDRIDSKALHRVQRDDSISNEMMLAYLKDLLQHFPDSSAAADVAVRLAFFANPVRRHIPKVRSG